MALAPAPPVAAQDHPVTQEIRSGFPFVVLHAGNLGFYGAWETVIKAAEMLDHEEVGFVFVGEGALRSQVEAAASGVDKIKFLPFRPPDQVPYVLAAGDLHLVTIKRGLEGVVVPSKLYSTSGGRPPDIGAGARGKLTRRAWCAALAVEWSSTRTIPRRSRPSSRNWPAIASAWPKWASERFRRRETSRATKNFSSSERVIEDVA